jgi:hypothetical protein
MAAVANGDTATAETQLKSIVGTSADIDASMGLGLLYESQGNGPAAVPYYQHVLDVQPGNQAAQLAMSRVRPVEAASPAAASPAASQEN